MLSLHRSKEVHQPRRHSQKTEKKKLLFGVGLDAFVVRYLIIFAMLLSLSYALRPSLFSINTLAFYQVISYLMDKREAL